MDEPPSPVSSINELQKRSHRYTVEEDGGEGGSVKCTGKGCESYIADCVAICCCPCAVVNILAFTFLKVPYMMGRKWLRKGKRKMRNKKRKCESRGSHSREMVMEGRDGNSRKRSTHSSEMVMEGRDGNSRKRRVDDHEGIMLENDIVLEFGVEDCSARFEDNLEEDVWLELCKLGHLGFGRISLSGEG